MMVILQNKYVYGLVGGAISTWHTGMSQMSKKEILSYIKKNNIEY